VTVRYVLREKGCFSLGNGALVLSLLPFSTLPPAADGDWRHGAKRPSLRSEPCRMQVQRSRVLRTDGRRFTAKAKRAFYGWLDAPTPKQSRLPECNEGSASFLAAWRWWSQAVTGGKNFQNGFVTFLYALLRVRRLLTVPNLARTVPRRSWCSSSFNPLANG